MEVSRKVKVKIVLMSLDDEVGVPIFSPSLFPSSWKLLLVRRLQWLSDGVGAR